jgi:hypothetical protein
MKITPVLVLIALVLASIATPATAQPMDRYDRYERDYTPPPSRRAAPPPPAPVQHAAEGRVYFTGQMGLFSPNDSSDGLAGYDSGLSFTAGVGSRVAPLVAIEGLGGTYWAKDGSRKAYVNPLTFGARFIVPNPYFEPYFGAGLGIYFTHLEEPSSDPRFDIDDSDTTIGGYGAVGIDMWLNNRTALTIEAKYQMVEPTFHSAAGNSFDVDLSGWMLSFGARVDF